MGKKWDQNNTQECWAQADPQGGGGSWPPQEAVGRSGGGEHNFSLNCQTQLTMQNITQLLKVEDSTQMFDWLIMQNKRRLTSSLTDLSSWTKPTPSLHHVYVYTSPLLSRHLTQPPLTRNHTQPPSLVLLKRARVCVGRRGREQMKKMKYMKNVES